MSNYHVWTDHLIYYFLSVLYLIVVWMPPLAFLYNIVLADRTQIWNKPLSWLKANYSSFLFNSGPHQRFWICLGNSKNLRMVQSVISFILLWYGKGNMILFSGCSIWNCFAVYCIIFVTTRLSSYNLHKFIFILQGSVGWFKLTLYDVKLG